MQLAEAQQRVEQLTSELLVQGSMRLFYVRFANSSESVNRSDRSAQVSQQLQQRSFSPCKHPLALCVRVCADALAVRNELQSLRSENARLRESVSAELKPMSSMIDAFAAAFKPM